MIVLPPGNILQNMYLKSLIKRRNWSNFFEIGSGNGYVSKVLLDSGLKGVGCDLNESACANNRVLNNTFISENKYEIHNKNFLELNFPEKFDLIISCMVIEHLEDSELDQFIKKAKQLNSINGSILLIVPSSMKHWGIEDEIAGHIKRYEFEDFNQIAKRYQFKIKEMVGLTYPLSNLVFRISNYLVKKHESDKLAISQKDKTVYTGNRNVSFKTTFPNWMGLFLNEFFLWPFYYLQKRNFKNKNALVIATELNNNER